MPILRNRGSDETEGVSYLTKWVYQTRIGPPYSKSDAHRMSIGCIRCVPDVYQLCIRCCNVKWHWDARTYNTCVGCAFAKIFDSMRIAARMHHSVWDAYRHLLFIKSALLQWLPNEILVFRSRTPHACNGHQINSSRACTNIRTTSMATGWTDHIPSNDS